MRNLIFLLMCPLIVGSAYSAPESRSRAPVALKALWQVPYVQSSASLEAPSALQLTSRLLLVYDFSGESFVALDRAAGRELWRWERGGPGASRGEGPRYWRLEGAVDTASGEVTVLSSRFLSPVPDGSGSPHREERVRLAGVNSLTGQILWQEDLRTARKASHQVTPAGVLGRLVVIVRADSALHAEFRDAATGAVIDLHTPSGRAALIRARALLGTGQAVFGSGSGSSVQGVTLDLVSGKLSRLRDLAYLDEQMRPLMIGKRIVARIDLDDGYLGHSVAPKYVCCTNRHGRKVWQFPRRFAPGPNPDLPWYSPTPSVTDASVQRSAGVVAVCTDRWQGLRVRDGALLWRLLKSPHFSSVAPYRDGFLALQPHGGGAWGNPDYASLALVNGKNGHVRWLTRLPGSRRIAVEGDQLLLCSAGRVYAYRLSSLTVQRPPEPLGEKASDRTFNIRRHPAGAE